MNKFKRKNKLKTIPSYCFKNLSFEKYKNTFSDT